MNLRMAVAGLALALVAGTAAYQATVSRRAASTAAAAPDDPAAHALMNWLEVANDQRAKMAADDPTFTRDLARLRAELQAQRDTLAKALEDSQTSDARLEAAVEAVIAADNALERRVMKYLLAVRPHLTADQQRRLFGLCADEVRQGGGRRWRGGAGPEGQGPNRGPGYPGRRRGMGWRNDG